MGVARLHQLAMDTEDLAPMATAMLARDRGGVLWQTIVLSSFMGWIGAEYGYDGNSQKNSPAC
jgi:hypothetical protein